MPYRKGLIAIGLLATLAVAHAQTQAAAPADAGKKAPSAVDAEEQAQYDQLMLARTAIQADRRADALAIIDKVIAHYQTRYPEGGTRWFVARSSEESLAYMLIAASEGERGKGKVSAAVAPAAWWATALYMKAFVLVDLGRKEDAKEQFERVLNLSPYHSQALSELGNLYQVDRDWPKALDYFNRAQEAAAFSLPDEKTSDATRALRGQGFVLVELKRIDEAEAKYRKCLKMDPNDAKAKAELGYISQLRAAKR